MTRLHALFYAVNSPSQASTRSWRNDETVALHYDMYEYSDLPTTSGAGESAEEDRGCNCSACWPNINLDFLFAPVVCMIASDRVPRATGVNPVALAPCRV